MLTDRRALKEIGHLKTRFKRYSEASGDISRFCQVCHSLLTIGILLTQGIPLYSFYHLNGWPVNMCGMVRVLNTSAASYMQTLLSVLQKKKRNKNLQKAKVGQLCQAHRDWITRNKWADLWYMCDRALPRRKRNCTDWTPLWHVKHEQDFRCFSHTSSSMQHGSIYRRNCSVSCPPKKTLTACVPCFVLIYRSKQPVILGL